MQRWNNARNNYTSIRSSYRARLQSHYSSTSYQLSAKAIMVATLFTWLWTFLCSSRTQDQSTPGLRIIDTHSDPSHAFSTASV